jgi:hypothetical protein
LFDLDFSSGGGTSSGIPPSQPNTNPTSNNLMGFDMTSGNSSGTTANPLAAPAQSEADRFAALQGNLGNLFSQPAPSPFAHLSPQNMGQPGMHGAVPGMPGAVASGSPAVPQTSQLDDLNSLGGQQMPPQMQGQMPQMMPGGMQPGGMPMMTPQQMQNMNPQQLAQMQMMLQAQMQMMMQMQMQMQQPGGYPGQQPPGGAQPNAPLFNDLSAEFQQKASLGDPGNNGQMNANSTTAKPAGGSPFDMFG